MEVDGKMGVHLDGSMGFGVSRLEVIEGPSGRRRRTKAERARIAAEKRLFLMSSAPSQVGQTQHYSEGSSGGQVTYMADLGEAPREVAPPPSPKRYWTRRGIAEWLVERLTEDIPTVVGIDHAFSFPLRYFEVHGLLPDWPTFLDDFQRHWPTDADHTYVDFVRLGTAGNRVAREGSPRWRRMTEERSPGAKSVFHFDVQGSVAKSTHAGIPWLLFIRRALGDRVHFWPFDGWGFYRGTNCSCSKFAVQPQLKVKPDQAFLRV